MATEKLGELIAEVPHSRHTVAAEPCLRCRLEAALADSVAGQAESQINELAQWIMTHIKGEPSRNEGAVECACRLLWDAYCVKPMPPIQPAAAKAPRTFWTCSHGNDFILHYTNPGCGCVLVVLAAEIREKEVPMPGKFDNDTSRTQQPGAASGEPTREVPVLCPSCQSSVRTANWGGCTDGWHVAKAGEMSGEFEQVWVELSQSWTACRDETTKEVARKFYAAGRAASGGQPSEKLTEHIRTFVEQHLYYARNQENLVDQLLVMVLSAPLAAPAAPELSEAQVREGDELLLRVKVAEVTKVGLVVILPGISAPNERKFYYFTDRALLRALQASFRRNQRREAR